MLPVVVIVLVVLAAVAFFFFRGNKTPNEGTEGGEDTGTPKKPEAKPERKPDGKPETKPERKPEAKPETKPEAKPEAKPESRPEAKPESKPEVPPDRDVAAAGSQKGEASGSKGETSSEATTKGTEGASAGEANPTGDSRSASTPASGKPRAKVATQNLNAYRKGLTATRSGWVQKLVGLFGGKKEIDPELVQQIEETLLSGDVGVKTTERLIATLKERFGRKDLGDAEVVWSGLREVAHEILQVGTNELGAKAKKGEPLVILVVGVNGAGKTTTIGKLAQKYKDEGKKVHLAAGDTFRAAAASQLEAWGKRVGAPVVRGKDLSKPSAVIFDAVQAAAKDGADIVIADTAGRLHTKTPLMDELRKLKDAAGKALAGAPHEILLVLDATTGQNGFVQVKEFREALDLTGIILTKLDGTARGGVILSVCDEFKLPVRFVGVGEKVDDLREFNPEDFADALFERLPEQEQVA